MAELTHFYATQDTEQTTTSAAWNDVSGARIAAASLSANTKYLVVCRALMRGSSVTDKISVRVQTADDSTIESKSAAVVEVEQSGSTAFLDYGFVHSFTTDGTPDDIDLQFGVDNSSTVGVDQITFFVLDLDAIGTEGTDYHEDIQAVDGTNELSTTVATTILTELSGADLGTDEWLVFGYARVDVGSAGRWFDIRVDAANDSATSNDKMRHRAEGEDVDEQRLVAWAIRHKASSGTPNVTVYGQESAAAANHFDGGAYMIALPTSLFADFEYDYTEADITVNGETTVATVGPYTPSVGGNHLIIGQAGTQTGSGLLHLHLEDGTTETRTGDQAATHNQEWDSAPDREYAWTMERISFSTSKTYNLRADRGGAVDVRHRWLLVINLNAAGGGSATVTPADFAVTVADNQPGAAAGAGPADYSGVVTVPQADAQGHKTVALAAFAAPATMDRPVVDSGAGPAAFAATVTADQATPSTGWTATASDLPAPVTIDQAVPAQSATITPVAFAATVAADQAAPSTGATVTPADAVVPVTVPQADAQGHKTVALTAFAAPVSVDTPGIDIGNTRSPTAIVATVTVDQAVPSASSTVTPTAVAATVTADQAVPSASSTVAPVGYVLPVTVDTPVIDIGVTRSPAAIAATVTADQATLSASSTVTPAAVAATVTVDQPGAAAGAGPADAIVTVSVPQATPDTAAGTTVTPAAFVATVSADQPGAAAGASPADIVVAVTAPQVTPATGATVAPVAAVITAVLNQADGQGHKTVAASSIAAAAAVDAPTFALGAGVAPVAVLVTVTSDGTTITFGTTATLSAVAATVTSPQAVAYSAAAGKIIESELVVSTSEGALVP